MRAFRLLHILDYLPCWNDICRILRSYGVLNSHALQRVYFLVIVMALVGHVGACLFYRVGLEVALSGSAQNWLVRDNLVELKQHGVVYLEPLSFRYLRAMYWSIQTLDTVGWQSNSISAKPTS